MVIKADMLCAIPTPGRAVEPTKAIVSSPSYQSSSATVNVKVPLFSTWPARMVICRESPGWSVEKSSASAVAAPSAVMRTVKTASSSNVSCGFVGSAGGITRTRTCAPV